MCGLFGILTAGGNTVNVKALHEAANSLSHRGPDDEGYLLADTESNKVSEFCGDDSQVKTGTLAHIRNAGPGKFNLAFGFRRLSILDLSPLGHQPMSDTDGKIWAILNGEIYNYIEIREELKKLGYKFKSGTDTEVIIYSYLQWGDECFRRFNGMWAIMMYDRIKQKLICSRDRFGVKPLYYFRDDSNNDMIILASELKAILKYLRGTGYSGITINDNAVYDYLVYTFVDHNEETFLDKVKSFPASNYLSIDTKGNVEFKNYFSLDINEETPRYDEARFERYCDEFRELLTDSISLRLRTDVPIGSCLSGGLDSSSIVSIVNRLIVSGNGINRELIGDHQKTFSAVYDDKSIDESRFISEVVNDTQCDAHFISPDSKSLTEDMSSFIYHLDEPFVSTSMYAQWNVMKLARQNHVKVLLDGQGSDETTAGYPVYYTFFYVQLLKNLRLISFASELSRNMWVGLEMIKRGTLYYMKNKIKKSADSTLAYFNPGFLSTYSDRNVLQYKTSSNLQVRLLEDIQRFSLPMLLRYEDRNSMAFSIEARTPFLDYRLVQFLMELPVIYKMKNGWSKWILRESMKGQVNEKVLKRKDKKGFPTPERKWLSEIKSEIVNTINDSKYFLNDYVDAERIADSFDNILRNKRIKSHFLWRVYNLAKWKKVFGL